MMHFCITGNLFIIISGQINEKDGIVDFAKSGKDIIAALGALKSRFKISLLFLLGSDKIINMSEAKQDPVVKFCI